MLNNLAVKAFTTTTTTTTVTAIIIIVAAIPTADFANSSKLIAIATITNPTIDTLAISVNQYHLTQDYTHLH